MALTRDQLDLHLGRMIRMAFNREEFREDIPDVVWEPLVRPAAYYRKNGGGNAADRKEAMRSILEAIFQRMRGGISPSRLNHFRGFLEDQLAGEGTAYDG